MSGKGSGRRPEQTPGAYADGHDRIFGKKPEVCRTDGRCQYAIDHDAEGMGRCPEGKCVMPDHGITDE